MKRSNIKELLVKDSAPVASSNKQRPVACLRPPRNAFFRTSKDHRESLFCVTDPADPNSIYILNPALESEVAERFLARATLGVTPFDECFVWLAKQSVTSNKWMETRNQALEMSATSWVRLRPNHREQCFDIVTAPGVYPDPVLPKEEFCTILEAVFSDRIIMDRDHHVIQRLEGRAA